MATNTIDKWLKRIVMLLTAAVLILSCFFIWRISMVAYRIETSIEATSGDIKQVTHTAANISRKVDQIEEKVEVLSEKTKDVLHADEVRHIVEEISDLKEPPQGRELRIDESAAEEISHLLSFIRKSECTFEYSGKKRSAFRFYLQMYSKYKVYKKTLSCAEDFIEKVATRTIAGNTYSVYSGDKPLELNKWLRKELETYRKSKAKGIQSDPRKN